MKKNFVRSVQKLYNEFNANQHLFTDWKKFANKILKKCIILSQKLRKWFIIFNCIRQYYSFHNNTM